MPNRKKRMAAPAQGYLRQIDAARFCGTSIDTVQRATKLWTASGGRYGLRSFPRGRARSYAVADLVSCEYFMGLKNRAGSFFLRGSFSTGPRASLASR